VSNVSVPDEGHQNFNSKDKTLRDVPKLGTISVSAHLDYHNWELVHSPKW